MNVVMDAETERWLVGCDANIELADGASFCFCLMQKLGMETVGRGLFWTLSADLQGEAVNRTFGYFVVSVSLLLQASSSVAATQASAAEGGRIVKDITSLHMVPLELT